MLKKDPDLSRYLFAEGTVLNLSDCEIGEGEFEAFVVPFLKTHPEIKILDLSNMAISYVWSFLYSTSSIVTTNSPMTIHELDALVTVLPPALTELYLNVEAAQSDYRHRVIDALSAALPKTIAVFDLNITSISPAEIRALAAALSPNLTKFTLCCRARKHVPQPVHAKNIQILADVLNKARNLTALTLTGFVIDAPGAKALGKALTNQFTLAKLDLSDDNIDVDGMQAIAESIADKQNLTALNLGANIGCTGTAIGSVFAKIIASVLVDKPYLAVLDLSWNWIGVDGAKFLADALGKLNLKRLDLSGNSFKDEGVKVLCGSLVDQSNLEHLNLGANEMTDVGAEEIYKIFVNQPDLTRLDLQAGNVSDEGIQTICNTPKKKPNFSELDVSHNKMGDTGAVALSKMISVTQNLSQLNLKANLIGDEGAEAICDALVGKEKIEKFNCRHNPISDRVVEMLASVLATHPSFSWKQNGGMRCLQPLRQTHSSNGSERVRDETLKHRCERMLKEADPIKRANFARQKPVEKQKTPVSTEQSSEISTTQSGSAEAVVPEKKVFPTLLPSLRSMTIFAIQKVLKKGQDAALSPVEKELQAQLLPTQEELQGLLLVEQNRVREAKLKEVLPANLVEAFRPKM